MPERPDDQLHHLDHFDPEVPVPLSAAEIRRRGDRVRRRNTALVAGAAAVAVIAVATPLALVDRGPDGSRPVGPATTSPSTTAAAEPVTTEIPDGFPLAGALPETNDTDGTPVEVTDRATVESLQACDTTLWTVDAPAPADVAGAAFSGFEDSRSRTLVTYPTEAEAQAAIAAIADGYAACTEEPNPDGTGVEEYTAAALPEGAYAAADDVVAITQRSRTDSASYMPPASVEQAVRVGNALLVTSNYGEFGTTDAFVDDFVADTAASLDDVVTAMGETFGTAADPAEPADPADPTDEPADGTGGPDGTGDIPADFALGAGWPTDSEPGTPGLEVPVDSVESFSRYACDAETPAPVDAGGVLRGRFSDVEDYRTRELLSFPDADTAMDYMDQLDAFFSECPYQLEIDGYTYPVTRIPTEVGGQSFGVVRSVERDGEVAIGLTTLQVVRVGRAVLLETTSGEGSATPDAETAGRAALDAMTADAADLLAAMCTFTEADC